MQHTTALSPRETEERYKREVEQIDRQARQQVVAWALLGVGFCMAGFAQFLGEHWIARAYDSGYSLSEAALWRLEPTVLTIRSIGFLLFAAGLVERVLIRFGK